MKKVIVRNKRRTRRKHVLRKNIYGTSTKPRLSVFRSNKYIYVQAIDDEKGVTIASASNLKYDKKENKLNIKTAAKVGQEMGEKLIKMNISNVVFDRNGFLYTGKIKSLADGARKAGLKF
jgi:large subunit ribosomal protein L18